MSERRFSIVVSVNDNNILERNLLLSPGLLSDGRHQLVIRRDFRSASLAYNSGLLGAEHDLVIFVHQDVYLPDAWFAELGRCLDFLDERKADWGVLGCFGSRRDAAHGLGRVYTTGMGWHGRRLTAPEPVETLDEIILIIRKSSGLRFDSDLPHFHLYGTDLCMAARQRQLVSYAFQGSCIHNTNQLVSLPTEFYACYRYVRQKWLHYLPIHTSCIRISFFREEVYRRRIKETGQRLLGMSRPAARRVDDPRVFSLGM